MSASDDISALAPAPAARALAKGRSGPVVLGCGMARGPSPLRLVLGTLRLLATALVPAAAAAVAALLTWDFYMVAPWMRDGRVRVQVASVAPQVSGQSTEVRVVDDQFVREGDVLYVIDRFDYQNAFDQAEAQVRLAAADYQVKRVQAERRQHLPTSPQRPSSSSSTGVRPRRPKRCGRAVSIATTGVDDGRSDARRAPRPSPDLGGAAIATCRNGSGHSPCTGRRRSSRHP